ncbi:AUGMIN subunit 7 [Vitis vinifera]|uniref:AUGMIN subunit 7 n=1 Tax=Vitis vinifera TaxID=29760 RepID=A0A438IVR6_VITVI|nr:AUGMIN subunit 7 [Vitis vinifera]
MICFHFNEVGSFLVEHHTAFLGVIAFKQLSHFDAALELQGNSPLDSHDGGTTASWVWTSCQSLVGGVQDAFEGNLRNLRDSHAAVAVGSSETIAGQPSPVTRIISECESALTFLNRDLGILSASIAREQGEEFTI